MSTFCLLLVLFSASEVLAGYEPREPSNNIVPYDRPAPDGETMIFNDHTQLKSL